MSFGFAIGDFIAASDKALLIYRKSKSAPDDLEGLAQHIQILANVLAETKAFLTTEKLSESIRLEALVSARDGCATTLKEVDIFLGKYDDIRKKGTRRYIQLAKFITRDVEGLKAKLGSNTALLQLSLSALMSSSIVRVEKALNDIQQEYQSGLHTRTTLTSLIQDGERGDREELLNQLLLDLEDKDVHPDTTDLHEAFVSDWLSMIIINNGLEENLPTTESEHASASPKQKPHRPEVPGTEISSSSRATIAAYQAKVSSAPKFTSDQHATHATIHAPPPIQFAGSADWETTVPAELDSVFTILAPLFETDPDQRNDDVEMSHRIVQSFLQYDWSHRGFLTRKEVLTLCVYVAEHIRFGRALGDPNIPATKDFVWARVLLHDQNRDGQLSKGKYTKIMMDFVKYMSKLRHDTIEDQIRQSLKQYLSPSRQGLPWQWPKQLGTPPPLCDIALGIEPGKMWMSSLSFTELAREAETAVDAAGSAERRYSSVSTIPFSQQLSQALSSVRNAALAFTLFEHRQNPLYMSDLDSNILLLGTDVPEARAKEILIELDWALGRGVFILSHIRAFSILLRAAQPTTDAVRVAPEHPSFISQEEWRLNYMEYRSRQILKWMPIFDKMAFCVAEIRSRTYWPNRLKALKLSSNLGQREDETKEQQQQTCEAVLCSIRLKSNVTRQIVNRKIHFIINVKTEGICQRWKGPLQKVKKGDDLFLELGKSAQQLPCWCISQKTVLELFIAAKDGEKLQVSDKTPSGHVRMCTTHFNDESYFTNLDLPKSLDLITGSVGLGFKLQKPRDAALTLRAAKTTANWTTELVDLYQEMRGSNLVPTQEEVNGSNNLPSSTIGERDKPLMLPPTDPVKD